MRRFIGPWIMVLMGNSMLQALLKALSTNVNPIYLLRKSRKQGGGTKICMTFFDIANLVHSVCDIKIADEDIIEEPASFQSDP